MLKTSSVAFLLLLFSIHTLAQELEYTITISGKHVGSMLVTKKILPDQKAYYSSITDVEYSLFGATQLVYLYEAIFKNDILEQGYFIHKKNGASVEEKRITQKAASKDYLTYDGTEKYTVAGPIQKSMLKLYFQAPHKRDSAFSERFHKYVQIVKLPEEQRYIFQIPNGDKNIYSYNNAGICEKITVSSSLFKFEMLLKKQEEIVKE